MARAVHESDLRFAAKAWVAAAPEAPELQVRRLLETGEEPLGPATISYKQFVLHVDEHGGTALY
jgi:hypothetical protein